MARKGQTAGLKLVHTGTLGLLQDLSRWLQARFDQLLYDDTVLDSRRVRQGGTYLCEGGKVPGRVAVGVERPCVDGLASEQLPSRASSRCIQHSGDQHRPAQHQAAPFWWPITCAAAVLRPGRSSGNRLSSRMAPLGHTMATKLSLNNCALLPSCTSVVLDCRSAGARVETRVVVGGANAGRRRQGSVRNLQPRRDARQHRRHRIRCVGHALVHAVESGTAACMSASLFRQELLSNTMRDPS